MTSRRVAVIGTGSVPFGKHEDASLEDLGGSAARAALAEAGFEPGRIEAAFSSNVLGGGGAGQRILARAGVHGVPVVNAENACASGTTAVHLARLAVAAGVHDVVLVVGAEKMTGRFQGGITLDRTDRPTLLGLTMPAIYALNAQRYAYDHGADLDDLAEVSVKNRAAGAANPQAMFRKPVTRAEVLGSRPVADPLTLLQCCANADGAAALVLAAENAVSSRHDPVWLLGSGLASGSPIGPATEFGTSRPSRLAARRAYAAAGVTPDAIDLAEVHDAFTIGEIMSVEALGLAGPGKALHAVAGGELSLGGRVPVNAGGGLLSKGHPVGATGVGQVVELVAQLRGRAGERQVGGASLALAHTVGGGVATLDAIASGVVIAGV
ncbi:acetyl-CoA acetyltransferase [Thermocatellispora tengchongensis]|uniref:propanoyl-CoA C-acyltransferase n=1 Tax=Thermocatellispora tengchongensis TaxID=1073253 RepID=A0A840PF76_9ACTN|nr:thiolase family protein [Thermocatellispora tengchongensis]MBB5137822.1 acetyl-CoA acetyltransferase [Thermocatellispora tengchongensis]